MVRRLQVVLLALLAVAAATEPGHAQITIGPLRVVLLVDSSSAVGPLLGHFRAGLNAFMDALPAEPEVGFITTGGQIRVRVAPTTDRQALRKAVSLFASDGGANSFVETMIEADKRFLKTAPDRRPVFVMLMTDQQTQSGEIRADLYNRFVEDFMRRHGRAHGVVIHGVNMGMTTDVMINLTGNTGGFYEGLAVANSLPEVMKYVAAMVTADIP